MTFKRFILISHRQVVVYPWEYWNNVPSGDENCFGRMSLLMLLTLWDEVLLKWHQLLMMMQNIHFQSNLVWSFSNVVWSLKRCLVNFNLTLFGHFQTLFGHLKCCLMVNFNLTLFGHFQMLFSHFQAWFGHFQEWFVSCAEIISNVHRQPVKWTTPIGFPIFQPYFKIHRITEKKNKKIGITYEYALI